MPFFVWTADNSVCHHDGPSSGRVDEREHFFCHAGIIADIGPFGEPASKIGSFGILCRHDADGELGGSPPLWHWRMPGDVSEPVTPQATRTEGSRKSGVAS